MKKSLSHLSDKTKNLGSTLQGMFASRSDSSVYSKGVRELDDFGYEKFNIEDDSEIFISRTPEKSTFNDGDPIMVRATGGAFVGPNEKTVVSIETDGPVVEEVDPSKLFGNVQRGSAMETEYRATMGKVTEDGAIEPRPGNSFMDRMARVTGTNARTVHRIEFEDVEEEEEAPVEVTADTQMFLQIDDDESVEVPGMDEVAEIAAEVPVEPVAEEFVADVAEDVTAEIAAEEVIDEVAEAPAEEVVAEVVDVAEEPAAPSFLDRMARVSVEKKEFFVDDEEPAEAVAEADEEEDDDYSWITFDEESEETVEASEEIPVITFTEAPVEEPVYEEMPAESEAVEAEIVDVPVYAIREEPAEVITGFTEVPAEAVTEEVPVEEALFEDEPVTEAEEVFAFTEASEDVITGFTEAPVEEPVHEEMSVEEPVTEAEDEVVEAPAVMSLPTIEAVEPEGVSGLKVEGTEESSESCVEASLEATQVLQAVPTSATVEEKPATKLSALSEDGEALPPLSDPVVRRPRTFRFSNGVLQNVGSEKVEPKEELRDPLA